jgi:uncharacterized integral membrane protein
MLLCMIVAVFALQNAEVVPVKFVFFQQEASLVIVILAAAFLGLLVGVFFTMYLRLKYFWEGRKKNETIKSLTDEKVLLEKKIAELEKAALNNPNGSPGGAPPENS